MHFQSMCSKSHCWQVGGTPPLLQNDEIPLLVWIDVSHAVSSTIRYPFDIPSSKKSAARYWKSWFGRRVWSPNDFYAWDRMLGHMWEHFKTFPSVFHLPAHFFHEFWWIPPFELPSQDLYLLIDLSVGFPKFHDFSDFWRSTGSLPLAESTENHRETRFQDEI